MIQLFDAGTTISLTCAADTEEPIRLALLDLQRDLRRLSGQDDDFKIVHTSAAPSIRVETDHTLGEVEAYRISVTDAGVTITGSDTLGTVFGIYAFSTKCLGILPFHRLTDLFPAKCKEMSLSEQEIHSPKRLIRFRGWFLNDEDLLTEWRISGGKRNIDYPFYQDVMDVDVLDMILETALRMEINLVIPASFVNIDNPDEEKLVRATCRRGLYVSQHHVEPMGVSYFAADEYLQKHGCEGETVSFLQNRARMEEIWTYYAKKWAKYGDRVIWQLGLRGKADQAVWKADPNVPDSIESRGGIITDAIGTQYEIIRKMLGNDDFFSTATLWNEGSELYGKGVLRLPPKTIPIFSDLGLDQMFGEDLYKVGLTQSDPYGVYYHACFWTRGPHLTEGCDPEKMAFCYREAARNGNLCYSILNVSNVRPVHLSAALNAHILSDPLHYSASESIAALDRAIFGDAAEAVTALREQYFTCFADFGETPLQNMAQSTNFYFHEYPKLPFIRNASNDGQLSYFGKYMLMGRQDNRFPKINDATKLLLAESARKFEMLYIKETQLKAHLPENSRAYFDQFLKYQTLHMQLLTEWCIGCMELLDDTLPKEARLASGENACKKLEQILEERHVLETGIWKNWHRGDKKINIRGLLKLTAKACEELEQ